MTDKEYFSVYKYDPPPDEPRHRKKAKKRHVKSDHKHEYEPVCIDAHDYYVFKRERHEYYEIGLRCKVCGRLGSVKSSPQMREPIDGMPLYEVSDSIELFGMKYLPDEKRVR